MKDVKCNSSIIIYTKDESQIDVELIAVLTKEERNSQYMTVSRL